MRFNQSTALLAFRSIAKFGSFTRAAAEMDVSTSALSQTIRQLENALGVRLLHRTTRRVSLTEAGQMLLARIDPALSEIDAALEETRRYREVPGGVLRLTVPRVAAVLLLSPFLADFMHAYPDIRLEIEIDDSFVDLISERFDAGIRLGEAVQRDMIAIPLGGQLRSKVVASPEYLNRYGIPQHPNELIHHRCLCHHFSGSGAVYHWEFIQDGRPFEIALTGPLLVNDNALRIRAAIDGAGLTYAFEPEVSTFLKGGQLMSVLNEWLQPFDGFYLYCSARVHMAPKLRVFIDFFQQKMQNK